MAKRPWVDLNTLNKNKESALGVLSKKGTLTSLMTLINEVGTDKLKVSDFENQTALDHLQKRKDKDETMPLVEKTLFDDNLQPASPKPKGQASKNRL